MKTPTRSVTRRSVVLGVAALSAVSLAACSSSGGHAASASGSGAMAMSSSASTPSIPYASAAVGDISITGGYIPQPASPDVAAAYLTITNNGSSADTLTKVTSSVTTSVMAMNETDSGGVGSMTDLADVTIPAHGSEQFVPNHAHLMLQNPKPLKAGDQVTLTLTFAHAGTVTVTLPVIPLLDAPTSVPTQLNSMAPTSSAASMPGMPGMSG